MPHTTHAYPFEAKVGRFADELSRRFTTGASLRSFLLVLDRGGSVLTLSFEEDSPGWNERVRALEAAGAPYLFYDPLEDGMEYVWVSWQGIEQGTMERLIGQVFDETDFIPLEPFQWRAAKRELLRGFPVSWSVMF